MQATTRLRNAAGVSAESAGGPPKQSSGSRTPGLDGLRALSISFVLLGHLSGTRDFHTPELVSFVLSKVPLATLGVRTFFVISGFLITCLLIQEEARTDTVSLTRFYFRRTLRIFPPFYSLIAVVFILQWAGYIHLRPGDLLHAATYTTNYHRDRAWHIGHTWSLAVEEQFYLLWPFLFRIVRKYRVPLLCAYIVAAPLWRLTVLFLMPAQQLGIGETFFTTADSIAVGCLLALVRPTLLRHVSYRRIVDSNAFFLIAAAIPLIGVLERYALLDFAFCISAQNVLIAVVIERATRSYEGAMSAVLNWRPVVLMGLWSYSIYLWQQFFLNRKDQASFFTAFPVNLLLAFVSAAISYYVVERPALRLRLRIENWLFARRSDELAHATAIESARNSIVLSHGNPSEASKRASSE